MENLWDQGFLFVTLKAGSIIENKMINWTSSKLRTFSFTKDLYFLSIPGSQSAFSFPMGRRLQLYLAKGDGGCG